MAGVTDVRIIDRHEASQDGLCRDIAGEEYIHEFWVFGEMKTHYTQEGMTEKGIEMT
jgi:hypothetical protein